MTKQETINYAWDLLELLESLPDSVDISIANVSSPCSILPSLSIQLQSGIEAVSKRFDSPIETSIPNEFIYKRVFTPNCGFVQLESAAGIIKAALGADNTEDSEADGKTI